MLHFLPVDPKPRIDVEECPWKDFKPPQQSLPSQTNSNSTSLRTAWPKLLETARRELGRDQEAAKASLVTASHILQAEIERCSGANGHTRGGLAAWQIVRARAYIDSNLHRTIHIRDLSEIARRSKAHFSRKFKLASRRVATCLRSEKASGEGLPSDGDQCASLSEIALSVDFRIRHLCRLFRQAFGQSPANWRRGRRSVPGEAA